MKPIFSLCLLAAGILAVTAVQAKTCEDGSCLQQPSSTAQAASSSRSAAKARSASKAAAASMSAATGGAATAAGGTATASNSVTVVTPDGRGSARVQEIRSVGIAPDISANTTAPCRVAVGLGGGPMGWAASIFGSTLDEGCDARADIATLLMMGRQDAALARACQKPELGQALGCVAVKEDDKTIGPIWRH